MKPALTDFFSGPGERQQYFDLVPGQEAVLGRLFYPEDPVDRPIELHHLHGCLTHLRMLEDGTVWKFDAADVRAIGVYEYLMGAEDADFVPSVILGSRKVEKAREWPFSYAFLCLEQDGRAARTLVIVGYSFRDEAVNARLAAAASGERRWIVVDRREEPAEAQEFRDRVSGVLGTHAIKFALEGLAGELPEVA